MSLLAGKKVIGLFPLSRSVFLPVEMISPA
jgi:hypothetical protein